jgi:hypothetical protein
MMAYNIDINDENISKRTSLIYMMYKKTYNQYKIIKQAPSWKILTDFGGILSIIIKTLEPVIFFSNCSCLNKTVSKIEESYVVYL